MDNAVTHIQKIAAELRMLGVIILLALSLSNCNNDIDKLDVSFEEMPVADFEYRIQGSCNTDVLAVLLFNESKNSDSFEWDFGDGTASSDTNPTKVYDKDGRYTITLRARRGNKVSTMQTEILMPGNDAGMGPEVSLSYTRTNVNNLTVEFTVSANDLEYILRFGDGEMLRPKETQVRHTYSGIGFFEASVMVENGLGWNCASVSFDLHP